MHFYYFRTVTGEPTASIKPATTQKWMKNKRAGGGAVIPSSWLLHIQEGGDRLQKVAELTNAIRSMGSFIDGFEDVEIRVIS